MIAKRTRVSLVVALALQQLGTGAYAQQNDATKETVLPAVQVRGNAEPETTYNPSHAVSATKIDAPLRDIPQTVNVVPQQILRDQNARSMESVLKTVPGVGLSHGDGQRDQVTIRGFSAIADQFIDGLRDDALYFRDLSNVEQVEVIKGPASVLYGRGSSGGLVNRITKKPGVDKSEVAVQVGSWNQRRGEFDIGRNLADSGVAFRVTGAVERADSYRDKQFLDREALAPSLSFKLGADTSLLLQAEYLSDERVTDFGIPAYLGRPVKVSPSTYYGAENARDVDTSKAKVTAMGFTLNHRFNEQFSLRNAFRHYDYELNRRNTLVGSVTAQTASLTRGNVFRDEDGYFNQTELTQKLKIGGMGHQILYGVEFGKQNKDQFFLNQANAATVSLFDPVNPILPLAATGLPSTDNRGIMKTESAYIQDLVAFSKEWKLLAGARYDRFQQETEERIANRPDLSRTDAEWSPRAGIVYQPTLTQSYYASISKSFQPSAEAFPLAANNEQIAPEKTTNTEVGAKFDFFGGLASATASIFRLERTNIKTTDPAATNRLIPIGEQRTDGLELTFNGDLSDGWQVWAGYAYLDARVTKSAPGSAGIDGKRATLTPKHSANLWVTKTFAGAYRTGAGINYVDERAADPANTVMLPGYTTVDFMLGYRLAKLDLQLNINNVFDREYIVSGHGSSPNLNLPGAPRNVQLTARYNF
jgi:catecholate siderophore receptor